MGVLCSDVYVRLVEHEHQAEGLAVVLVIVSEVLACVDDVGDDEDAPAGRRGGSALRRGPPLGPRGAKGFKGIMIKNVPNTVYVEF